MRPGSPTPAVTARTTLEGGLLRLLKQRDAALIAARDLNGPRAPVRSHRMLTTIAELAVSKRGPVLVPRANGWRTNTAARRRRRARLQELIVVGMGKLGGAKLNVSSDIDLIFVYPEDGETDGPRALSNSRVLPATGARLITPSPKISPDTATCSGWTCGCGPTAIRGRWCLFDMLENYLLTQGREWERYAWIKGRPLSGRPRTRNWSWCRPFVFRKYFDFGAIYASLRGLHARSATKCGAGRWRTTSSSAPAASAKSNSSPRCSS